MAKIFKKWTAVCGLGLGMLLCGCGETKGQEIILIGKGDTESSDSGQSLAGMDSGMLEDAISSGMDAANGTDKEEVVAAAEEMRILVHVCGAVVNSGVVALPQGSRAEDALLAAGGFAEDASRDYVNLAGYVSDGEKLYFPTKEEVTTKILVQAETDDGLVNINTADVTALCTLPGIGESRARDIISYREAHGDFESCEDIMKVSGIKTSVYNKLSDKIKVK